MRTTYCTASSFVALLAFIDSGVTPRIAYDRDDLATALVEKLRSAVGDKRGSQRVGISFGEGDDDIQRQFEGCCANVMNTFGMLKGDFKS